MQPQLPDFVDVIDIRDPNDPIIEYSLHAVDGGVAMPSREEMRAAIAEERIDELGLPYFYSMTRDGRTVFYVPDGNHEHECRTRTAAIICLRHVVAEWEE